MRIPAQQLRHRMDQHLWALERLQPTHKRNNLCVQRNTQLAAAALRGAIIAWVEQGHRRTRRDHGYFFWAGVVMALHVQRLLSCVHHQAIRVVHQLLLAHAPGLRLRGVYL